MTRRVVHCSFVAFVLSLILGIWILIPSFSWASNQIADNFRRTGQSETLVAPLARFGGVTTTQRWSGLIEVIVSGEAINNLLAGLHVDPFWEFFPSDPTTIQGTGARFRLSFTGCAASSFECNAPDIILFMVFTDGVGFVSPPKVDDLDPMPLKQLIPIMQQIIRYTTTHTYHFVIDVGSTWKFLTMGDGDGGVYDNFGQFNIQLLAVVQSVPFASSAPSTPTLSPPPTAERREPYTVVRTFFATDRNLTQSTRPDEMFGDDRAQLRYGTCDVSIPQGHSIGELEAPSIRRLEFREDPTKHVVLLSTTISPDKGTFFADVSNRVRRSDRRSAFLFVHGYNVTFEDAARRTAQISHDLGFKGAPVFYSWPSQGATPAYTVDEQNIEWAQANLRGFLEDFFERSDAQSVYLIAHSMGNRALTRAVASLLTDKPAVRDRLKEVILAAPDIDAAVFQKDIAPPLTATGRPITLYASSEDLALVASKKIHGYPRAGDSGQELIVLPGIETIDATGVDTSLWRHSYFAETRSVLSDMSYLIQNDLRPDNRFGLRAVETQTGRYWEFKR